MNALFIGFILMAIIVGSVLLTFALVRKHIKKRCTVVVNAVISNMAPHSSDALAETLPHVSAVYTYVYNGQQYNVPSDYAIDHHKYHIGDTVQLHINPNKPTEYIGDEDHFKKIYIVFGVIMLSFLIWILLGSSLVSE